MSDERWRSRLTGADRSGECRRRPGRRTRSAGRSRCSPAQACGPAAHNQDRLRRALPSGIRSRDRSGGRTTTGLPGPGWGQSSQRAGIPGQGLEIAAMDDYSQPGQAFMSALVTELVSRPHSGHGRRSTHVQSLVSGMIVTPANATVRPRAGPGLDGCGIAAATLRKMGKSCPETRKKTYGIWELR